MSTILPVLSICLLQLMLKVPYTSAPILFISSMPTVLPVLSTGLVHTNIGYGKEKRILIGPW